MTTAYKALEISTIVDRSGQWILEKAYKALEISTIVDRMLGCCFS